MSMFIAIAVVGYVVWTVVYDIFFKKMNFPQHESDLSKRTVRRYEEEEDYETSAPSSLDELSNDRISTHPDEKFVFQATLDTFAQKTAIEDRSLDIHLTAPDEHFFSHKKKRAMHPLIGQYRSKRSLIIAKEIIDPPLSLREGYGNYR